MIACDIMRLTPGQIILDGNARERAEACAAHAARIGDAQIAATALRHGFDRDPRMPGISLFSKPR
jgi:hypothetical protein